MKVIIIIIIIIMIIVALLIRFIMTTRHHIPEESDLNRGLNVVKTTKKDVTSIPKIKPMGKELCFVG
jgi:cytochrome b subunit of formate dehydrogenase